MTPILDTPGGRNGRYWARRHQPQLQGDRIVAMPTNNRSVPVTVMRMAMGLSLITGVAVAIEPVTPDSEIRVVANDNRMAGGTMSHDTLHIDLVLQRAEWYPEAEDGPHVTVEAFSEAGKAPVIPSPLIRVTAGTVIHATVRNTLNDSTAHVIGLGGKPTDTLHVVPGGVVSTIFRADAPGTYLYRAQIGDASAVQFGPEHNTAGGALVVDPVDGSRFDRIFVINIISFDVDSITHKEALAINGKSWPHTERISMTVGDSLRWRVLNSSIRPHPMHLHGFYFRITASGNGVSAQDIPADRQHLMVTDNFLPWSTRDITWSPDRPGNWLFHCHLTFHVIPEARLGYSSASEHQTHSPDPLVHMAGLVLGLNVAPKPGHVVEAGGERKQLDLHFNQGPARGRMPATFSYILQGGATAPPADSVLIPGSPLFLTRGDRVDITVHNHTQQPGGVHWHGIELESWSDGVVGWSNRDTTMAPPIMPGGSFTAHMLLPRAGTFMYHTHMNDIEQVTGGAAGAMIVSEPGEPFDSRRDHVYLSLWHGLSAFAEQRLLINGDSLVSPDLVVAPGVQHRFRFINIGPAGVVQFRIHRDTTLAVWRRRAKDGADLPATLRSVRPAVQRLAVGETYDFEFTPPAQGRYRLTAALGTGPALWSQNIVVGRP